MCTTGPNPFYNCLAFANKHQVLQGGFDDKFSDNWLSTSRQWRVENIEISQNAQGRQLSQTKGNVWNHVRFLKKHFTFLEELNQRIRENGINLRLPCIYLFQVSPFHCHKTQRTSLSFWISRIYLVTQTTFSDSWVPLTFFPAATLVVYHIRIKMREKINVLTQHSVKANTKPLSERQSLSESCGGSHQT